MSNGILYQLPSSHLFIHRVPAKLSNRVIALRSELLQATALVYILILLTCPFRRVRIFRGRITLSRFAGLRDDVVLQVQHRYRVSFQNPARFQNYLEPRKALESFILSTVLCCNHFLLFWTSDVPQHLLRIIDRAIFQNPIDDSQKLAGYDNQ